MSSQESLMTGTNCFSVITLQAMFISFFHYWDFTATKVPLPRILAHAQKMFEKPKSLYFCCNLLVLKQKASKKPVVGLCLWFWISYEMVKYNNLESRHRDLDLPAVSQSKVHFNLLFTFCHPTCPAEFRFLFGKQKLHLGLSVVEKRSESRS